MLEVLATVVLALALVTVGVLLIVLTALTIHDVFFD